MLIYMLYWISSGIVNTAAEILFMISFHPNNIHVIYYSQWNISVGDSEGTHWLLTPPPLKLESICYTVFNLKFEIRKIIITVIRQTSGTSRALQPFVPLLGVCISSHWANNGPPEHR